MSDAPTEALHTTESLNELTAALAKAQALFPVIEKNRTAVIKPRDKAPYSYRYADIADVLAAVRQPLSANGLAITQVINHGILQTALLHSSDQRIVSNVILTYSADDPKVAGYELTYRRRHAACALLGIAADDDTDAEGAEGDGPGEKEKARQVRKPASKSEGEGRKEEGRFPAKEPSKPASEGERNYLANRAGDGLDDLLQAVGAASLEALTKAQFIDAKSRLVRAA